MYTHHIASPDSQMLISPFRYLIHLFHQPTPQISQLVVFLNHNNNFKMTHNLQADKAVSEIEKKMIKGALLKSEEEKKIEIFEYGQYDSEFMHPMESPSLPAGNINKPVPKINKSMVLSAKEAEQGLSEIYNYYNRAYDQPRREYSAPATSKGLNIKAFLLFAKDFRILKTIFSLQRLTVIFKKHADYGKYLSFDNFYFTINSISHQHQTKTFFNLESMMQNLDVETIEQLEKQEFYNYLQLGSPERFRSNFTELFGPFNTKDKPRAQPLRYDYRKFSLPELRKKALPETRQKKKGEKDLFILKHDRQAQHNIFDEAKSIVVSWDSLRAKSVNNLGKPSEILQKKYIKADPEEDPYLREIRPASKQQEKCNKQRRYDGHQNRIAQRIKEIQDSQNMKNKQILDRIDKKLKAPTARRLQM